MTAPTISATVILPDGSSNTLKLPSDDEKRLAVLQQLVGGYIEGVALPDGRYMMINENGKDAPHVINVRATAIAHEAQVIQLDDYIAGVAAIVTQEIQQ